MSGDSAWGLARCRRAAAALSLLLAVTAGATPASGPASAASPASATSPTSPDAAAPVRLRIVGGLAHVAQYTALEQPFWTRELPRLSGGRVQADIVPYDQAGIRAQEMLHLVQIGAVPFGTLSLGGASASQPLLAAPDLAGLNVDMPSLRRSAAAFRPFLRQALRERYGIELLAVYVYPAQALFCRAPFGGLADLAGRRIRVASPAQADWVEALGATAVPTAFAAIVPNVKSGALDCAITGTMSGNTIGLHEVTSHLSTMSINWGLSIFIAQGAAWAALPPDVRSLLQHELPRLEQAVWADAERETGAGIACNTGAATCRDGRKGAMQAVVPKPADEQRRREIVAATVLPRWVKRCGAGCADAWNATLAGVTGLQARRPAP